MTFIAVFDAFDGHQAAREWAFFVDVPESATGQKLTVAEILGQVAELLEGISAGIIFHV